MTKSQFTNELQKKLSGLPKQEACERINFYCEMIDDRMEEGYTEEAAVSDIGSIDEIVSQVIRDIPLTKIAKEKIKPKRRLRAWEIVLLALGSPIWLSLAIAAFAILVSFYAALWAVIVSLWAVFAALVGCSFGVIVAGCVLSLGADTLSGVAMIGAGLVCAGLGIFSFFGCRAASCGGVLLTKTISLGVKKFIVGKEKEL